jgi:arabinose-5-phosphate isomerase
MIALTAKKESSLAKTSQVTLDISVREEACPLGLAPTSSTTVSLALCDAIAMSVLKLRGFNEKDFAEFHPGGSLGKRLLTRVKDVMHESTPSTLMKKSNSISEVISLMTSEKVKGVAGVVDENDNLIGIVTDGDIRRGLKTNNSNFLSLMLVDIMSKNPKTIHEDEMAEKALFVMQQFQIQSLFVLDNYGKPIGLLHLQDLIAFGLR